MRGLFITGTDTDVGKTFVTALIARELVREGLRIAVSKPACSGAELRDGVPVWPDLEVLGEVTGVCEIDRICRQRFTEPLAPPVAARLEQRSVDFSMMVSDVLNQPDGTDLVLVEGVGGLLCPLTSTHCVADLAKRLGFPLLIVARLGLGTINHTLLTVEAALHRKIPVAGIILNDGENLAGTPAGRTNFDELQVRSAVPVLGLVAFEGKTVCLRDQSTPARIKWNELAETGL